MKPEYFSALRQVVSLETMQLNGPGEVLTKLPPVPTYVPQEISNTLESSPSSEDAPITEQELENAAYIIASFNEAHSTYSDLTNRVVTAVGDMVTLEALIEEFEQGPVSLERATSAHEIVGKMVVGGVKLAADTAEVVATGTAALVSALPSLEAYRVNPIVSQESMVVQFKHGLETVWRYIKALFEKLLEQARALWKWFIGILAIRRKNLEKAKVVATEIQTEATSEHKRAVTEFPLHLHSRTIRDFWLADKAALSTDFARDAGKLAVAFGDIQNAIETVNQEWARDLLGELKHIADKIGTVSTNEMDQLLNQWSSDFNRKTEKHRSTISHKASSHVGGYIGCISVKATDDPLSLASVQVPHALDIPVPDPAELRALIDAGFQLELTTASVINVAMRDTKSVVTAFTNEIDVLIKRQLSSGLHVIKFRKTFQGHLTRFQKRFATSETKVTAIAKRIQDIIASINDITNATKAAYKKVGVEFNEKG